MTDTATGSGIFFNDPDTSGSFRLADTCMINHQCVPGQKDIESSEKADERRG